MDQPRRKHSPGGRPLLRVAGRRRLGLTLAVAVAAGCSGLTDNADGVSFLEIRLPANGYLEATIPLDLDAVARNAAGEAVDVGDRLRWLTPDTTVALDSATGLVTPRAATGTARIQVGIFGIDTVVTAPSSLVLTLTAKADTLLLLSPDSVEILRDRFDTAPIQLRLDGGSPLVPVVGRPVTFRVIEPAPSDSPAVVFASGRAADSLTTTTTGVTATVRGAPGRPIPDRAVIEINAWRATGAAIPGSGRRVVVRFRHQ